MNQSINACIIILLFLLPLASHINTARASQCDINSKSVNTIIGSYFKVIRSVGLMASVNFWLVDSHA